MSDQATMPNLKVRHFAVGIQSPDRLHEVVKISWLSWGLDHEVEVVVSPSGRSVQVFVDGEKR